MKIKNLLILGIISAFLSMHSAFALIKIDDDSIDLAIKYGIKMKGLPTSNILGTNWINDGSGRILNIYSPFIQIAMKATNLGTIENEDIKDYKAKLNKNIAKIKNKNEIRFIVSLFGDNNKFAQNYKAYIIDVDNKNTIINPIRTNYQKVADKDSFNQDHPYSGVNCYTFKFNDLSDLKNYIFKITDENGKEIKYKVNNNEIF